MPNPPEVQHNEYNMTADDAITDIRHSAVIARSQALTIDALGKGFVALQEIRQARAVRQMDAAPINNNTVNGR